MPTVWLRSTDRPRFHRDENCVQLVKKPARGTPHPKFSAELGEISHLRPRPCKTCYPDAPRMKISRRFCKICNVGRALPCEHNGGVLVTTAFTTSYISLLRDPGDEVVRECWIWPDHVWFYDDLAS